MKGYIHSTESFGTVDGPGIRFVVFFQGCPLRCLYCHNPDTWEMHSAKNNRGTEMSVGEILEMYDGVKEFCSGGITATGGEPLMQLDFLTELFEEAKKRNINTCLDTSGITFDPDHTEKFDRLMKSTDVIMLDIKHIDDEEHKKLTGHSNRNILEFARYLSKNEKTLWVRHVTVPGITYNDEYLHRLGVFLSELRSLKALDVLQYHDMGKVKYENLGIPYPLGDTPPLTKDEAAHARDVIMQGIKDGLAARKHE
ncbi:MAG: pyruvate formate lyase-activating protein [Oscillospiraceae bacterium]|nr:pyruvate formate lyase-activating protein [Oscillospiraceae bacterium]